MVALIVLALVVIVCLLVVSLFRQRAHNSDLQSQLDGWAKRYQTVQGYDMKRGNFLFLSLDSGLTWWRIERLQSGETVITGQVHKAEIAAIKQERAALRALVDHVQINGPINPHTADGRALLTDAGFTINDERGTTPD